MYKPWIALAIAGAISVPAAAQTAPQTQPAPAPVPVPAAKPAMVKKVVCQTIHEDPLPGSLVGSASRVCKTVEVPATDPSSQAAEKSPRGADGN